MIQIHCYNKANIDIDTCDRWQIWNAFDISFFFFLDIFDAK